MRAEERRAADDFPLFAHVFFDAKDELASAFICECCAIINYVVAQIKCMLRRFEFEIIVLQAVDGAVELFRSGSYHPITSIVFNPKSARLATWMR